MKKINLVSVLFLLSFMSLNAQTPYSYYYKGEKQYLEVSPNKVLVQFTKNMDTISITNYENSLNHDLPDLYDYHDLSRPKKS